MFTSNEEAGWIVFTLDNSCSMPRININMTATDTRSPQFSQSNLEATRESIRAFVLKQYPACRQRNLQDTDSLIDSGIVDSMGILELVAFVESDFGVAVEEVDLTPENFESIATVAAFVRDKR